MRRLASTALALAVLAAAETGLAETKPPVVIWPTLVPAGDGPSGAPLHKPQPQTERDVHAHAQEIGRASCRERV